MLREVEKFLSLLNYSENSEIPCTVMKAAALWLFNGSVNKSAHDRTPPVTAMWWRVTVYEKS